MNEKILLIRPPSSPQGIETDVRYDLKINPPLGLAYLASSLLKNGFPTNIVDCLSFNLSIDDLIEIVEKEKPGVIGFTVSSFSLHQLYNAIRSIRKVTNSKIIVGGPHITYLPEAVKHLSADFGIRGDAERSLVELVKSLHFGKRSPISGLVKRDGTQPYEKIARIDNLNDVPYPNRQMISMPELYDGGFATVITSRGCPHRCVYCGLPNLGGFKARSVEDIISELRQLKEIGVKYINFLDDCFSLKKARTMDLCEVMIKEGLNLTWQCETRVDTVDDELLDAMSKAGCFDIRFGVESFNERVRNEVIGKRFSNMQIYDAILSARNKGIVTGIYLLLGHPSETYEEMEETVYGSKYYNPHFIELMLTHPLPGSRLFDIAVHEGKISRDVWTQSVLGRGVSVYIPDNIKFGDLIGLQVEAYLDFYKGGKLGIHTRNKDTPYLKYKGFENTDSFSNSQLMYIEKVISQKVILNFDEAQGLRNNT